MNMAASLPVSDTRRPQPVEKIVSRSFVVNIEHGLHARPCALLVKTLQPYFVNVVIEANGEKASGHSILGLMALAAGYGAKVAVTITGKDAFEAMAAVQDLFETCFDDAYGVKR
jgi:phosphotransferase system HPr (HPr) family protein